MRGLHLAGKISTVTTEQGREECFALNLQRHPIGPLANRVWRLRGDMTAYDACYAALAEALECPLVTRDAKLSGRGHSAEVVLLG